MAYHWDVVAQEMQQNFYDILGNASWNLYQIDQHQDFLKNVRHLFTRLKGYPIRGQEMRAMCEEIRENYAMRAWRRDNFRDLVSRFVNKHKKTQHDNSSSLTAIHRIIDTYSTDNDEILKKHLHSAVTNAELPVQFSAKFLEISCELCTMIVEFQQGEEKNTPVSLLFVVFQTQIDGQQLAIAEPVFRVQIEPDNFAFVDRSLNVYPSWDGYLLDNFMLQGRYCYPEYGVYTTDTANQVRVAFYGTPLEDDKDEDEDEISENWRFFLEHYNLHSATNSVSPTNPCVEPIEDAVGTRTSTFLAEAYAIRSVWLPFVASILSEAASRVHEHIKETTEKGHMYSRLARGAAGALYASAATAYAYSVANILFSLPEKYEQRGTLTLEDTIGLYGSVRQFSVIVKHLRNCAAICRELLKSQTRKGAGRGGRCIYREMARDFYKTVSARVGGKRVKTVVDTTDVGVDLANLSNNQVEGDI